MPIRTLGEQIDHLSIEADICVIGAGVAGLMFASRASRSGKKVVVVESGNLGFDQEIHALNEIEDINGHYTRALDGRFRGFGGTSTRWGGRMVPIGDHETGSRSFIAQTGWDIPADALKSYEREIETMFGVDLGSYEEHGHKPTASLTDMLRHDEAVSVRWAKCPPFRRANVAKLLRRQLDRADNVDIWLGATVCDFAIDRVNARLTGVTARSLSGRDMRVAAGRFVIAAGTIETTRLLLLADRVSEGHAFAGCDALGRYFQDHLKVAMARIDRSDPEFTNRLFAYRFKGSTRRDLHLELSAKTQEEERIASAFAYFAPGVEASPLEPLKKVVQATQRGQIDARAILQMLRNAGPLFKLAEWRFLRRQLYLPPSVTLDLMLCVEQLPSAANRITLSDRKDRLGVPLVRLDWRMNPAEEQGLQRASVHMGRYWNRIGLDRRCPLVLDPRSDEPMIARAEPCTHPSGSARLGSDPATSVVRPDLSCHALPNVHVVSAAVFPTAGSANPTMTIMKLALWLGDHIAAPAPSPSLVTVPSAEVLLPAGGAALAGG